MGYCIPSKSNIQMENSNDSANNRNREIRLNCVDYATRIVGKSFYVANKDGVMQKHQDDVIEVAQRIHDFVMKD